MNKKALLEELKYIYQDKIIDIEMAIDNLNRRIEENFDRPKVIDGIPSRIHELQRDRNGLERKIELLNDWIGELQ